MEIFSRKYSHRNQLDVVLATPRELHSCPPAVLQAVSGDVRMVRTLLKLDLGGLNTGLLFRYSFE